MNDEGQGPRRSIDEMHGDVAQLLRTLPQETVIVWSDDTSGDEPVLGGGLDVWAPEIARPLRLNWVWTIDTAEGYQCSDPDSPPDPLSLIVPYNTTGEAGREGWTPGRLNRALEEWVAVQTGRSDLRFLFDPELMSDCVRDLIQREDDFDAPMVEDPEGVLHDLVENGSQLWTQCGLDVPASWGMRTAGFWITEEMDDGDIDREFSRGCRACGATRDE